MSAENVRAELAEVLGEHRYRDVLGDYEIKPYYRHIGCSCGWGQNIAGMSGYWSWREAHETHAAEVIAEYVATKQEYRDALAANKSAENWSERSDYLHDIDDWANEIRADRIAP